MCCCRPKRPRRIGRRASHVASAWLRAVAAGGRLQRLRAAGGERRRRQGGTAIGLAGLCAVAETTAALCVRRRARRAHVWCCRRTASASCAQRSADVGRRKQRRWRGAVRRTVDTAARAARFAVARGGGGGGAGWRAVCVTSGNRLEEQAREAGALLHRSHLDRVCWPTAHAIATLLAATPVCARARARKFQPLLPHLEQLEQLE